VRQKEEQEVRTMNKIVLAAETEIKTTIHHKSNPVQ
jgi:hypothetical protein